MKFKLDTFFRTTFIALISVFVFALTFFGQDISFLLRTSIVGYPQHDLFDGTVYPVQKVPDWVNLDSAKWNYDYDQLATENFIDIPYYNPSDLKKSTDGLKWGNPQDNKIRNAKITYSVPYMGNYLLDGKEYTGSHPAVDIKVPEGTPVFAIANGTIIKASNQSSGFGHHIVIQHNNFPTLDDSNSKEVIYSSYSHLRDVLVSEGNVVKKGDLIAKSGSTGTATTPHLHFQIDNDDAPWHPFWPFTWKEVMDAGLDFFSAVNEGLGQDTAIATTINPLKYVQAYLDSDADFAESINNDSATPDSYVPDSSDSEVTEDNTEETDIVSDVEPEIDTSGDGEAETVSEPEPVTPDPPVLQFEFETRSKYYVGQNSDFKVLLRDQYGKVYENGFSGDIVIASANGLITSNPAIASHLKFDDGELTGSFKKMNEGRDRLKIKYGDENYYSDWFEIIDSGSAVTFSDVSKENMYFDAISYLVAENVVAGYPDGTFKPNQTVSRVEALKLIYEGLKEVLDSGNIPFSDVSAQEWYSSYLYTAYSKGVVDGYPDGTFKPANTVNKAEFFKILFNGMGVDVNPNVKESPFDDVSVTEWYAPYVIYAHEIGIMDSDGKYLHPSDGMTRGEVAYSVYKLMLLMK